ncbi:hypothetical protein SDC9_118268 [bioreactor metagenome]|uniref:Uncharacterized protein n=1 Tax=bioreactor metagenome TaxID=1076179 RepID=A0A645C8U2_9ZZZZ
MRELYVNTCEAEAEDGMTHRYDYSVLIDEMNIRSGFSCESYGVKIRAQNGGEVALVPNITPSVSRIDSLMELLVRNAVTPCTLADVLSDWL